MTVDPRGNGRSDRPTDPSAYDEVVQVADAIAVLDELGVQQAVLVGVCVSAWRALLTAALHPDRVQGVVAVAPFCLDDTPALPVRAAAAARFEDRLPTHEGWDRFNRHHWLADWPDFAEFFFDQLCCEPHSTKVLEDAVGFALGTTGQVMAALHDSAAYATTPAETEEVLGRVTCPVLVVHGTRDRCQPVGRFDTVVRATGAERLVLPGAGHLPMAREPVAVSRAIRGFVDRVAGPHPSPSPARPARPAGPAHPGSRRHAGHGADGCSS